MPYTCWTVTLCHAAYLRLPLRSGLFGYFVRSGGYVLYTSLVLPVTAVTCLTYLPLPYGWIRLHTRGYTRIYGYIPFAHAAFVTVGYTRSLRTHTFTTHAHTPFCTPFTRARSHSHAVHLRTRFALPASGSLPDYISFATVTAVAHRFAARLPVTHAGYCAVYVAGSFVYLLRLYLYVYHGCGYAAVTYAVGYPQLDCTLRSTTTLPAVAGSRSVFGLRVLRFTRSHCLDYGCLLRFTVRLRLRLRLPFPFTFCYTVCVLTWRSHTFTAFTVTVTVGLRLPVTIHVAGCRTPHVYRTRTRYLRAAVYARLWIGFYAAHTFLAHARLHALPRMVAGCRLPRITFAVLRFTYAPALYTPHLHTCGWFCCGSVTLRGSCLPLHTLLPYGYVTFLQHLPAFALRFACRGYRVLAVADYCSCCWLPRLLVALRYILPGYVLCRSRLRSYVRTRTFLPVRYPYVRGSPYIYRFPSGCTYTGCTFPVLHSCLVLPHVLRTFAARSFHARGTHLTLRCLVQFWVTQFCCVCYLLHGSLPVPRWFRSSPGSRLRWVRSIPACHPRSGWFLDYARTVRIHGYGSLVLRSFLLHSSRLPHALPRTVAHRATHCRLHTHWFGLRCLFGSCLFTAFTVRWLPFCRTLLHTHACRTRFGLPPATARFTPWFRLPHRAPRYTTRYAVWFCRLDYATCTPLVTGSLRVWLRSCALPHCYHRSTFHCLRSLPVTIFPSSVWVVRLPA